MFIIVLLVLLLFILLKDDKTESYKYNPVDNATDIGGTEDAFGHFPASEDADTNLSVTVRPTSGTGNTDSSGSGGTVSSTASSAENNLRSAYDPSTKKTMYSKDLKDGDVLASGRTVHWNDEWQQWETTEPFIEDTTNDSNPYNRYAEYDNLDDLRNADLEYPEYSQNVDIKVVAEKSHEQMRLTFNWIDVKVLLTEFDLYNEDKTLVYEPVSAYPGEITYIINDVHADDVFYFHLHAPYLGGYTFIQEDETEYEKMINGDLSFYGDWAYDPDETS